MNVSENVWQKYHSRLRAFIKSRVYDDTATDDIFQDVFLKVHTGLPFLKDESKLRGWLYQIVRNAVIDHFRAQKPLIELPDDLPSPMPESESTAELATCLLPLISELPERYQSAILMSEIEGLSLQEVANRLGISLSGAKSRVQRGREKLRRLLLDCCDIEAGRRGIIGYEPRQTCRARCGWD